MHQYTEISCSISSIFLIFWHWMLHMKMMIINDNDRGDSSPDQTGWFTARNESTLVGNGVWNDHELPLLVDWMIYIPERLRFTFLSEAVLLCQNQRACQHIHMSYSYICVAENEWTLTSIVSFTSTIISCLIKCYFFCSIIKVETRRYVAC